ncbi:hypothetical protein AAFF_G00021060 [Aldrovandia affinis]|uniref:Uncharacterized protein n=1 Tax=Aldrovandia affinis TaxID=143900 RepID=A0AAD7WHI5_9TELE|nr:hypothetical protein AAFF_G00021060 [Aldrovandia affinis]
MWKRETPGEGVGGGLAWHADSEHPDAGPRRPGLAGKAERCSHCSLRTTVHPGPDWLQMRGPVVRVTHIPPQQMAHTAGTHMPLDGIEGVRLVCCTPLRSAFRAGPVRPVLPPFRFAHLFPDSSPPPPPPPPPALQLAKRHAPLLTCVNSSLIRMIAFSSRQ